MMDTLLRSETVLDYWFIFLAIYLGLAAGSVAKFHSYYHLKGFKLMLGLFAPAVIMIWWPLSFPFIVAGKKTRENKAKLWIMYVFHCVVGFPNCVDELAVAVRDGLE